MAFRGRGFTLMPLKTANGMGVVYGAPIDVGGKHDNPTEEQIKAVYAKYESAVVALFNDYKATFGYAADETLEIQ